MHKTRVKLPNGQTYTINKCPICARPILRQRTIKLPNGARYRVWDTQRMYCSNRCRQKAYRLRKRQAFPQS